MVILYAQIHVHVLDDSSNVTMIHDNDGHTLCTCTVHVLDDSSNDTMNQ